MGFVLGSMTAAGAVSTVLAMSAGDTAHVSCAGPSLSVANQTATALDLTCASNPTTTTTTIPPTTTTQPSGVAVSEDRVANGFGTSSVTVNMSNTTPEVAVAYVSADDVSPGLSATVSGGGLTWTRAKQVNAQRGDAEIWTALTAGGSFSVSAAASQGGKNVQLTVITYTNSAGIGAVQGASASSGPPTVGLTPQATGSLVGAVGMDYDSAANRTLGPGQVLDAQNTDSAGDTYWTQHLLASTVAGSVMTVNDTAPTSDRWDMVAIEVKANLAAPPPSTTTLPATTTTIPATTTTTAGSNGSAPVVDPSTPAVTPITNNATSATSPLFSPPAGAVLYAAVSVDSYPGVPGAHVQSMTNTGSPLTWNFLVNENSNTASVGGYVEVWWAYNPTAQTTITVTTNLAQATKNVTPPVGALEVLVVDHAAADQSAAPHGSAAIVTGTSQTASAVVNAPINSLALGVFDAWNSIDNPPALPTGQVVEGLIANTVDVDTYWVQGLARATTNAESVTLSATLSTSDSWHAAAWVVLPG